MGSADDSVYVVHCMEVFRMSNWRRVVFPLGAAIVVVAGMSAWQMPQVRASLIGLGWSGPAPMVTPQEQPQDRKPFIGIVLADNSARIKERLGLSTDQGVVITTVAKESPGAQAGLAEKDIITAINGVGVKTAKEVTDAVRAKKVGEQVTLTILRGSTSQDIRVTLGAAPERPKVGARPLPKPGPGPFAGGLGGLLGANPGENLRSAKVEITDKDGKTKTIEVVAGTVQSSSSTSISLVPNGDTTARSFQVDQDTRFGIRGRAEDLRQGDRAVIVAEGNVAHQVFSTDVAKRGLEKIKHFHRLLPGPGARPSAAGGTF